MDTKLFKQWNDAAIRAGIAAMPKLIEMACDRSVPESVRANLLIQLSKQAEAAVQANALESELQSVKERMERYKDLLEESIDEDEEI